MDVLSYRCKHEFGKQVRQYYDNQKSGRAFFGPRRAGSWESGKNHAAAEMLLGGGVYTIKEVAVARVKKKVAHILLSKKNNAAIMI